MNRRPTATTRLNLVDLGTWAAVYALFLVAVFHTHGWALVGVWAAYIAAFAGSNYVMRRARRQVRLQAASAAYLRARLGQDAA